MDVRGIGAFVALAWLATVASPPTALVGPAAASHLCGAVELEIILGTGAWLTDRPELEGVNHHDLAIPICSDGNVRSLVVQGGPVSAIKFAKICSENIVRVYATEGTYNLVFSFEWVPTESKTCSQETDPPQGLPL